MSTAITPRWLTLGNKGTAKVYCSVSNSKLWELIRAKRIRSVLADGRRLIDRESLDKWIQGETSADSDSGFHVGRILDQLERMKSAAERFNEIADRMEKRVQELDAKYIPLTRVRHYCGYDERTIRDAAKKGDVITFNRNGGKRVVLRESLDAWIEGLPQPQDETVPPTSR